MTKIELLDHYAGITLQSILAAPSGRTRIVVRKDEHPRDAYAEEAYEQAAAMLRARAKHVDHPPNPGRKANTPATIAEPRDAGDIREQLDALKQITERNAELVGELRTRLSPIRRGQMSGDDCLQNPQPEQCALAEEIHAANEVLRITNDALTETLAELQL